MTQNGHGDLEFVDRVTLQKAADQLAVDAAAFLAAAIDSKGGASIAVPGGATPSPFFLALAAHPIDWSKVRVTLTDERWVAEESDQSNARLVREGLLRGPAANAIFTPPQTMRGPIEDAARAWDEDLRAAPAFDLVVLGMGDDGHFASLFPDDPELAARLDPEQNALAVAAMQRTPQRLSLTLKAIIGARRLALLIAGEAKRALLDTVLRGERSELPVAALLRHARAAPTCYWGATS